MGETKINFHPNPAPEEQKGLEQDLSLLSQISQQLLNTEKNDPTVLINYSHLLLIFGRCLAAVPDTTGVSYSQLKSWHTEALKHVTPSAFRLNTLQKIDAAHQKCQALINLLRHQS